MDHGAFIALYHYLATSLGYGAGMAYQWRVDG